MNSPDDLQRIFDEAATLKNNHFREQLAFRHMIALADTFEGWAMDERMNPEQTARFLGWAESLRQLSDLVGPEWNPSDSFVVSYVLATSRSVCTYEPSIQSASIEYRGR